MTVTRTAFHGARAFWLAALAAAALIAALLPVSGAHAASHDNDNDLDLVAPAPGEAGQIVEYLGDDLVPAIRWRGSNRFDTAKLIAIDPTELAAPPASDTVILATGARFPDALSGSFAAGLYDAPILLGADDPRPGEDGPEEHTKEALEVLDPQNVVLLGGTTAISQGIEDWLEDEGFDVTRIFGPTRFETAAEVATSGDPDDIYTDADGHRLAIVASGENFPDALVSGALAFQGLPLLLTPTASLHPATQDALEELEIGRVLIAGGTAAVSQAAADAIEALDGVEVVERVSGPTRRSTAVEFAGLLIDEFGFSDGHVNLATGQNFPDALAVGAHAGSEQSPILLTAGANLDAPGAGPDDPQAGDMLDALAGCDFYALHAAGGHAAIPEDVLEEAREIVTVDEVCDILLLPETATNPVGFEHTVEAAYVNNAGTVFDGDIKIEVYRETAPDTFELVAETTVASPGEFSYEGDPPPAPGQSDVIIACDAEECLDNDAPVFDEDGFLENLSEDVEFAALAEKDWIDPDDATSTYSLVLSSDNEVGPGTATGVSPPYTGSGTIWVFAPHGIVCWDIDVDMDSGPGNGDPDLRGSFEAFDAAAAVSAGHIHVGDAGETGPIVVDLGTPDDEDGQTRGCTTVDADLIDAIEDQPSAYYANFHTNVYPGGVVRDQLGSLL